MTDRSDLCASSAGTPAKALTSTLLQRGNHRPSLERKQPFSSTLARWLTSASRIGRRGIARWTPLFIVSSQIATVEHRIGCNNAPLRTNGWLKAKTCSSGSYEKTQWHCPHCAMKWKWGSSAADRWIIIYSGQDDVNPVHFTWGHNKEDWCEHVFQWLRKVRLSQEMEKVRNEINLNNVIKCLDEMNNTVAERLEKVQNMEMFTTQCKDPATHANYPSCGLICPDYRLSVSYVGQPVRMGIKPSHSRHITSEEFIELCIVLLSMVDPDSYVAAEPLDRKVTHKAMEYRSQHYNVIKQIIDDDIKKQRRSSCAW
eukprot:5931684-Amphidinium_carterae.2